MSCANSIEPGTIDKGVTVAHEAGGGSGEANAHLVMAGLGAGVADGSSGVDAAGAWESRRVRASIASRSVVLPLWKGPTSAMHRGPRGLLTSCPIAASSSGARPLIGSARWMLLLRRRFGKTEKRRCSAEHRVPDAVRSVLPATRSRRPVRIAAKYGPGSTGAPS